MARTVRNTRLKKPCFRRNFGSSLSSVARLRAEKTVSRQVLAGLVEPRTSGVVETRVDRDDIPDQGPLGSGGFQANFTQLVGPYRNYSRKLLAHDVVGATDKFAVVQDIEVDLKIPFFGWFLKGPIYRELKQISPKKRGVWWLPPEVLDIRALSMLSVLAVISIVVGYQNSLMSQTLTYAIRGFHASSFAQSVVISLSRIDVIVTLIMLVVSDRLGRRRVLLASVVWGAILSAASALAPNLAWLAVFQSAARSFVAAATALIVIYAAEEMPAGSRAYAIGVLTGCGVLGAGANVLLVGLVNAIGWRAIFAASILGCLMVPSCARLLPESKRFRHKNAIATDTSPARVTSKLKQTGLQVVPHLKSHKGRLFLLICLGLLIQVFAFPGTQFLNQFLRTSRGFSPGHLVIFNVFTTIPGALGLFGGGSLADKYGRKIVASVSLIVGSLAMIVGFFVSGWEMWFAHIIAQILAGALIPATTVLGPELFPTNLRGVAYGVFTIAQGIGSVIGLLVVGWMSSSGEFGNFGIPMAMLGVGPLIMAVVLLKYFPETAHMELEEINPDDPYN